MSSDLPRLWVVDPSVATPEDQGVDEVLRGWEGTHRVLRPCLDASDGPTGDDGYDFDGVVVLGSACSVHDDPPWMQALAAWLGPLLDGRVRRPLLGICFGHQLIAHLAGGRVGFMQSDRTKTVGVETSRLAGGRLIEGQRDLRVVVSHREHVERAPAGYRVVAHRPTTAIDGLEHDRLPVYSFQFHPEAREEFAARAGIDAAEIDDRLRGDSQDLLGAFRDRVRRGPR